MRCAPCGADGLLRAEGFWQCPVCMTRLDPATDHGSPRDTTANLAGWAEPAPPEAPLGGREGDPTIAAPVEVMHAQVEVGPVVASAEAHTPGE